MLTLQIARGRALPLGASALPDGVNFALFCRHGTAVWGCSAEPDPHATSRRSVFLRRAFHWREDVPLLTPLEDTIVYELHVRGFTCHPSGLVAHPGTFAGLVEKVPYLQSLGITAVE